MQIGNRPTYLVVHGRVGAAAGHVKECKTLIEVLSTWTAASRVSPIWHVKDFYLDLNNVLNEVFYVFVGPVRPARIAAELNLVRHAGIVGISITAGSFNVILKIVANSDGRRLKTRVINWARRSRIPVESWGVSKESIKSVTAFSLEQNSLPDALHRLAGSQKSTMPSALRVLSHEMLLTMGTGLARSANINVALFSAMEKVAAANLKILEAYSHESINLLDVQSRVVSMNAALSRFCSQTFSGISPILKTECHFWLHSLLGTGSANLALHNLVSSIQRVLGEARLPERIQELGVISGNVPSLDQLTKDSRLLNFDIMTEVALLPGKQEPIVPLVTYFSGRDGFSSQIQTLSAPIATIAECNSHRSNLLTVTHELSHIFIQGILSVVSPTIGDDRSLREAREILSPRFHAVNWLQAARQLFLEAIVSMEKVTPDGASDQEIVGDLPYFLEKYRQEAQEILVHTFDFVYFHASEPEYYIRSIWNSWCAIPGIGDRVPEYLMRTICAVSANLLSEKATIRFASALRETRSILSNARLSAPESLQYVEMALEYLENLEESSNEWKELEQEYSARIYLTRFIVIFLYSSTLASDLFTDPYIGGGVGYHSKKPLTYDLNPIGNAINFLRRQLKSDPTEAESLWVLHGLAFDLTS